MSRIGRLGKGLKLWGFWLFGHDWLAMIGAWGGDLQPRSAENGRLRRCLGRWSSDQTKGCSVWRLRASSGHSTDLKILDISENRKHTPELAAVSFNALNTFRKGICQAVAQKSDFAREDNCLFGATNEIV